MALPRARTTAAGNAEASTWEAESVAGSGTFDLTGVSVLPVGGNAPYDLQFRHPTTVNGGTTLIAGDGSNTASGGATTADACLLIDGVAASSTAGGKLTINPSAVMIARGNSILGNNNVAFASLSSSMVDVLDNNGGTFRIDSFATGKAFRVHNGGTATSRRRVKGRSGALFESASGGTNGHFYRGQGGSWDLQDSILRRLGTSSVAAIDANPMLAFSTTDPNDAYFRFKNVILEECGQITLAYVTTHGTYYLESLQCFDGLGTYDLSIVDTTVKNSLGTRKLWKLGLTKGWLHNNTVIYWDVQESVLGLFKTALNAGASFEFAAWYYNTFLCDETTNHWYCNSDTSLNAEEYRSSRRNAVGASAYNGKYMSALNWANRRAAILGNSIFEDAMPGPVPVGDNNGEIIGHFSSGDIKSGWGLKNYIHVPREDGGAYSIEEDLTTGSPANDGVRAHLTLDHISGCMAERSGPTAVSYSVVSFGHNGTTVPGTNVIELTNSIFIGRHATPGLLTADYGAAQTAGVAGTPTTDAVAVGGIRKVCTYQHGTFSASANPTMAPEVPVGTPMSGTAATNKATLTTNNYFGVNPYSTRVQNLSLYLDTLPGLRRTLNLGKYNSITGTDDNDIWVKTWRALAAWQLSAGAHPAYPSGHTYRNAGVSPTLLRAWIREDWSYGLTWTADETAATNIGAVQVTPSVTPSIGSAPAQRRRQFSRRRGRR